MSGDLEELGFRERPVEKLEPFVKCADDETRDRLIAMEKEKAEKIKAELYGTKPKTPEPPKEPVKEEAKKPEPADTPKAEQRREPEKPHVRSSVLGSSNVRDRIKMDLRNLSSILANFTRCPELNLNDLEQDTASDATINLLDLTDEKWVQMSKTMSALELGGIVLIKALAYSKKMAEE